MGTSCKYGKKRKKWVNSGDFMIKCDMDDIISPDRLRHMYIHFLLRNLKFTWNYHMLLFYYGNRCLNSYFLTVGP